MKIVFCVKGGALGKPGGALGTHVLFTTIICSRCCEALPPWLGLINYTLSAYLNIGVICTQILVITK